MLGHIFSNDAETITEITVKNPTIICKKDKSLYQAYLKSLKSTGLLVRFTTFVHVNNW